MEKAILWDLECNMDGICSQMSFCEVNIKSNTMHEMHTHLIKDGWERLKSYEHEKNGKVLFLAMEKGHVHVSTFFDAMMDFMRFARQRRLPIVSHSTDCDIEFLYKTDKHYNSGIFKHNPIHHPQDCCTSKMWESIVKQCSQRLITECSQKTFSLANHGVPGKGVAKLEHLVGVLLDGRKQQHTSVHDIIDLFDILCLAHKMDNLKFPKDTFMIALPYNIVE